MIYSRMNLTQARMNLLVFMHLRGTTGLSIGTQENTKGSRNLCSFGFGSCTFHGIKIIFTVLAKLLNVKTGACVCCAKKKKKKKVFV